MLIFTPLAYFDIFCLIIYCIVIFVWELMYFVLYYFVNFSDGRARKKKE